MFKKYIKFLDGIVEKFDTTEKIMSFLKTYKWKIIISFLFIQALGTMYSVYDTGHCINCDKLTKQQIEQFDGDVQKFIEYSDQQLIYVPYTDIKTYLMNLWLPLILNLIVVFITISVTYVAYRISTMVLRNLGNMLNKKINENSNNVLKQINKIKK